MTKELIPKKKVRKKPTRFMADVSKEQIEQAIPGSKGLISVVAQRLNTNRDIISKCLTKWPSLSLKLAAEVETVLDYAENKLFSFFDEQEFKELAFKAIKFYLTQKGSSRGYGRTSEDPEVQGTYINCKIEKAFATRKSDN